MKYSKSDGAYFRKSKKENYIKGGKLIENGKLEDTDFSNNVVPTQHVFPTQKIVITPIKVMKQRLTDEPYIFFGYDEDSRKYQYVCYNNMNPFSKNTIPIKCKKLVVDRNIFELTHADFLKIDIEKLIVLCYHFLLIRQKNHRFMNRLFEYLNINVFKKVLGKRFSNSNNHQMYKDMVEEIGKMVMKEGHRIFNQQHGGKLDRDGKLDSQDFNLEIKKLNRSVQLEEMTTVNNIRLPRKVRHSNASNINI